MAVTSTVLLAAKQAENSQTTQYTASNVTAIIDKCTIHNGSGGAVTFGANVVTSGGSASASNLLLNRSIAAGQTYSCPEIVGQILNDGDFLSTIAGTASALVIRVSGREIT